VTTELRNRIAFGAVLLIIIGTLVSTDVLRG